MRPASEQFTTVSRARFNERNMSNSHHAFKAANAVRFCSHVKAAEAPPLPALKKDNNPSAQTARTQVHGTPFFVNLAKNFGA